MGTPKFLIAIAALAGCCGCIPLYPTVWQPRSGRVLDGGTGQPIANAIVRVESYMVSTPPDSPMRPPSALKWCLP